MTLAICLAVSKLHCPPCVLDLNHQRHVVVFGEARYFSKYLDANSVPHTGVTGCKQKKSTPLPEGFMEPCA